MLPRISQRLFKALDGGQIQVIGGFIHYNKIQHIGNSKGKQKISNLTRMG
jgi:hypothetical protein